MFYWEKYNTLEDALKAIDRNYNDLHSEDRELTIAAAYAKFQVPTKNIYQQYKFHILEMKQDLSFDEYDDMRTSLGHFFWLDDPEKIIPRVGDTLRITTHKDNYRKILKAFKQKKMKVEQLWPKK